MNRKKTLPIIFIVVCMVVCLVPSLGLLVRPTSQPIGNERVATMPSFEEKDGSFNNDYLSDLGAYFEKSFAFRPEIITLDAEVQANVFGVSNVDSVVVGTDGWLFYSSTLDDFLGRNTLSDTQIDGIVHNLQIIQRHVNGAGAQFLFTVAPNKNTLYPQHMPYYYGNQMSQVHNRDLLNQALEQADVPYCNLFQLFAQQDEVLYLRADSHWNNKGALLAYNAMLQQLGKTHDTYATTAVQRVKDFQGDLGKMLLPANPMYEYNHQYGAEDRYTYVTETTSVEDSLIKTQCGTASGSLYMYRDSFGNSLLPFFASAYNQAVFTKSFPMMLQNDVQTYQPDTVVFELVERNVKWLITTPPIVEALQVQGLEVGEHLDQPVNVQVAECTYSPLYLQLWGTMDYQQTQSGQRPVTYVRVSSNTGDAVTYECFDYMDSDGNDGYLAYLDAADYAGATQLQVSVIMQGDQGTTEVGSTTVSIEG